MSSGTKIENDVEETADAEVAEAVEWCTDAVRISTQVSKTTTSHHRQMILMSVLSSISSILGR
jgi:hypothetical protein